MLSKSCLTFISFSEVYARVKNTYGSIDLSDYGDLEVIDYENKNGQINHGQVKKRSKIKHGRFVKLWNYGGEINDAFFKDGKEHGPSL